MATSRSVRPAGGPNRSDSTVLTSSTHGATQPSLRLKNISVSTPPTPPTQPKASSALPRPVHQMPLTNPVSPTDRKAPAGVGQPIQTHARGDGVRSGGPDRGR